MAGVRKVGEDFFWNSEINDKHKCSHAMWVEGVGSRERQTWFQIQALPPTSWTPLGKSRLFECQHPCRYNVDQNTFLPGPWCGSGEWMWKPFQTQVHGHVSHSSECQRGKVLGGDGYQAFLPLIMEMFPESMWGSPTSSWTLGRISGQWVSFDLGGKRGPPRPSQSKLAMQVPPTQLPLSTKRFVCVVSFELHNSLLRVGTAIIPILEKEMEAQRGIVIVIGLVLA